MPKLEGYTEDYTEAYAELRIPIKQKTLDKNVKIVLSAGQRSYKMNMIAFVVMWPPSSQIASENIYRVAGLLTRVQTVTFTLNGYKINLQHVAIHGKRKLSGELVINFIRYWHCAVVKIEEKICSYFPAMRLTLKLGDRPHI